MSETTKARARLDAIDRGHEWRLGQTYGHGGTCYSAQDVCSYCGLVREYYSDRQHEIDTLWTFCLGESEIPLGRVPTTCEATLR